MVLNKEQILELITRLDNAGNKVYADVEMLELIRQYVFDRKKVIITNIERPKGNVCVVQINNTHQAIPDIQLMDMMFSDAVRYYINEYGLMTL